MFEYYIYIFKSLIILLFLTITVFLIYIKKNKNDLDRIPGPKQKYPLIGNLDLFKLKGVPIIQCKFGLNFIIIFRISLKIIIEIIFQRYYLL